ncbi:MAG: NAD-dependent epimerase/dehydratase family protein [Pseudorhizobium sp.]
MHTTLVTGASGFIGAHLLRDLNRRDLPARGVSRQALPGLIRVPSYGPESDWREHLKGVTTVVHLAARVHVMRETAEDPLAQFRQANVDATVNLARQAAEAGVKRFVFVSSIKVNGERTAPGKPFTADDPPNPQDPYAVSKAEAEAALEDIGRETRLEIVIIRPPLVYGPGVGGNFRSLMRWAASGAPSIFSKVKNRRSLVYVGNLCDLVITTLEHPDAAGRTFLVSDGEAISSHELLSTLTSAFGQKPRSVPVSPAALRLLGSLAGRGPAVERILDSLEVDISATRETLSWEPPFTCSTGLAATVAPFGQA